jgi:hypothetical protein
MVCNLSSCGCGCGYNSCATNLALSCKNPFSVCPCPTSSAVYCLFVTNQMTCSVRLCLTLSDSTTTSTIIPGFDTSGSGVQVGPFTSGAGVSLTITFMEASVYPVCGKLCPLYNNTLPQTYIGTGVEMSISSAGVVSFPGGYTCV